MILFALFLSRCEMWVKLNIVNSSVLTILVKTDKLDFIYLSDQIYRTHVVNTKIFCKNRVEGAFTQRQVSLKTVTKNCYFGLGFT